MSKMRRIAAGVLGAITALTAVGVGAGTADAGKLPGGYYAKALPGGGKVTIRLADEYVRVSRPVTNSPFTREVWVSGKARVATSGPVKGATVTAGYLVGCQLTFGATADVTGGLTTDEKDQYTTPELRIPYLDPRTGLPGSVTIDPQPTIINSGSGSTAGFSLGPGQAVFQPVVKMKVDGKNVDGFTFTDPRGGITYSQERFAVDGCAGFAQARALVNVRVANDQFRGNVTMYGKPFSIG